MDYYRTWSEYQQIRMRYATDDINQWRDADRERAIALRQQLCNINTDDIYDSMRQHIKGEHRTTWLRKLLRRLVRGSR